MVGRRFEQSVLSAFIVMFTTAISAGTLIAVIIIAIVEKLP